MKKLFQTLALVSLAIAGMMVSSCQVENIQTSFEPSPAVATVTVSGIDVANPSTKINVTNVRTDINLAGLTTDGNIITITGNPDIKALDFTVFASYNNVEKSTKVQISALAAGGKATYPALVVFGEVAPGYFADFENAEEKIVKTRTSSFYSLHNLPHYTHNYSVATHGHGVGDGVWLYNEYEFILETEIEYESINGFIKEESGIEFTADATENDKKATAEYLRTLKKAKWPYDEGKDILPIKVSAFAMYSAYGTMEYRKMYIPYFRINSDETNTKVADVVLSKVITNVGYVEACLPGHEGHYHFGHGHDDVHGYSSNAGGGIMWTE